MALATALSAGGLLLSGIGAIGAGNSQAASLNYQAQVARNQAIVDQNNATQARNNANYAGEVGMTNAAATAMKGAAISAKIKGAFAANNINPNTGTAADVGTSQSEINKLNSENVLSDAQMKAYGYNIDATNYAYGATTATAQSQFDNLSASDATTGGYLKASGSLLSGLSSLPISGWFNGGGSGNATASSTGGGTISAGASV